MLWQLRERVEELPGSITSADRSFQLDSIVLFDKLDRLENTTNAIPLKKVAFTYDYSLCKGIDNHASSGSGKLTLKKITNILWKKFAGRT